MTRINVLDPQTANLIAAGEVVDRPAAVTKELLENAIDAGSTKITVEIKNGGSTLIRVTDNGKGMSPEDVKACILRHATSKIKNPEDLEGIMTLGFRGEALAAISSVSRFQVISKEPDAEFGTCMTMEAEEITEFSEVGCPDGTTITVRDIFFNVPARRKFLKKDATETAYISQYVERIALSHPDISLRFIVDSRVKFSTPGTNNLRDTIYSVYGREFVDSLMPIERKDNKLTVRGFVSHPEKSRINRNHQILFVNGRLVRSRIVSYAVEDAYKSYIMTERYPAFVIFLDIDPYLVDINVHPTKLEVRFVDDAFIRQSVYFAVKNEIEKTLNPIKEDYFEKVQENLEKSVLKNSFVPLDRTEKPVQEEIQISKPSSKIPLFEEEKKSYLFEFLQAKEVEIAPNEISVALPKNNDTLKNAESYFGKVDIEEDKSETVPISKFVKYKGIVFDTYVIAEYEDSMYIIDKHAAHERIIYESLKSTKRKTGIQSIIDTRVLTLDPAGFDAVMSNLDDLVSCGFDIEEFGDNTIALRGIPSEFSLQDVSFSEKLLLDIIDDLVLGKKSKISKSEAFDRTLYTAACKAATKAGFKDSEESYVWLINKLFECENVFCCPHGRPVIVKYTKSQVEKMFFRT